MKKLKILLIFSLSFLYGIQNHPTDLVISRIVNTPVSYPIRFVFLGDSRKSFNYWDPDADSIFSIAREQIDQLHPLFVIHGGDFVQDGYRSEFLHFVEVLDSSQTNFLTVRGNHELYADEGPFMYDSIFGNPDYYFDYGRYRFIILADCQQDSSTNQYGHYIDYLISNEQLNWLDSLLADAQSRGLISFVFAHVPPYQPGHDTTYCLGYSHYIPYPNYERSHTQQFTDMLTRYNVPIAFFSHHHFYDRHEYQGVWYIISGGAGAPLYGSLSPPPYGCSCYHFLSFELDSVGIIKAYFYHIGNEIPDPYYSFTVSVTGVDEIGRGVVQSRILVVRKNAPFMWNGEIFTVDGRRIVKTIRMTRITLGKEGVYFGIESGKLKRLVVIP